MITARDAIFQRKLLTPQRALHGVFQRMAVRRFLSEGHGNERDRATHVGGLWRSPTDRQQDRPLQWKFPMFSRRLQERTRDLVLQLGRSWQNNAGDLCKLRHRVSLDVRTLQVPVFDSNDLNWVQPAPCNSHIMELLITHQKKAPDIKIHLPTICTPKNHTFDQG